MKITREMFLERMHGVPRPKRGPAFMRNQIEGRPKRTGQLSDFDRLVVTEYMRDFNFAETGLRLHMEGDRERIGKAMREYIRARPWIRTEVQRRIEIRRAKAEISEARLLEELRRIAYANPLYHARVYDDDGNARLDFGLLTEDDMAGISSIEQKKDGSIKIKLHDKIDAIEKLGRRLKLFGTEAERSAPATVRFIVEDSPRAISGDGPTRRIAAEVRIGHDDDQSQGRRAIVHVEGDTGAGRQGG